MAVPRLVVPQRDVPELRSDGRDMPPGAQPDNLRGVPLDKLPVVSNGASEPEGAHLRPAHAGVLHIALVVPTLKLKKVLDQHVFALYPPDWQGTMKIHILVKDPADTEQSILLRYLVREAGLASSEATGFLYPEEVELGWKDEPA